MSRKHKTYGHFIAMVVVLILAAVGTSAVYKIARNRPPIAYGNLTPEAIDRLNKLRSEGGIENGLQFITEQLDLVNWDNELDYGAQDSTGWASISDDNFIVYYKEDLNGVWKQNAQLTLKLANDAIPKMKKVYGKYTYPEDLHGRKLPFYLPTTPSSYLETNYKLYGGQFDADGSLGMTVSQVSMSGYLPKGIVLHKSIFDASTELENSAFVVVPHELSHYVYGSLYQYSADYSPVNWVEEGSADYTAERSGGVQVKGIDTISFINEKLDLRKDFPQQVGRFDINQYWAGESFFNFVKDKYGKEMVTKFITNTYSMSIDSALIVTFPNKNMHNEWVNELSKNANTESSVAVLED